MRGIQSAITRLCSSRIIKKQTRIKIKMSRKKGEEKQKKKKRNK